MGRLIKQIRYVSNITLYLFKMDVGSSQKWISASTMMLWHHSHSTATLNSQNLGTTWPVERYTGASICPWNSILMAQTLCISNMDVWNGLRWISASTMTLWHHSHSTSDPEFPNLGTTWPVECYKGAPIWPWDSILMAQTLSIYLILMFEVVWGEYQHQPWRYGIIFTPRQVTHNT